MTNPEQPAPHVDPDDDDSLAAWLLRFFSLDDLHDLANFEDRLREAGHDVD